MHTNNTNKLANIELGNRGEQIAVDFLKKNGYRILGRNWQAYLTGRQAGQWGEIDIIAQDYSEKPRFFGLCLPYFLLKAKAPLVFVEVKTKSSHQFGLPEEEFTKAKRIKMQRAIQDWLWKNKVTTDNWRIDVIAIDFNQDKDQPEIRHHKGLS